MMRQRQVQQLSPTKTSINKSQLSLKASADAGFVASISSDLCRRPDRLQCDKMTISRTLTAQINSCRSFTGWTFTLRVNITVLGPTVCFELFLFFAASAQFRAARSERMADPLLVPHAHKRRTLIYSPKAQASTWQWEKKKRKKKLALMAAFFVKPLLSVTALSLTLQDGALDVTAAAHQLEGLFDDQRQTWRILRKSVRMFVTRGVFALSIWSSQCGPDTFLSAKYRTIVCY